MLFKGDFRLFFLFIFFFELETPLNKLVKLCSYIFQKNNFQQNCQVFYFHQKSQLFSNSPGCKRSLPHGS